MQICGGNHGSAVSPKSTERDVHDQVGGGGHPLAHLYLHHPVLRDTGAQPLHWRLRLVACHQEVRDEITAFYINLR